MKLSELGEFQLIQNIDLEFSKNLPKGVVGIGDDCAVIDHSNGDSCWLVTTDMLVEGTHFLFKHVKAEDLGSKTLAVNLSDIAAMGGVPKYCFLSMALPENLSTEWVTSFLKGFQKTASEYQVFLIGGDTTRSEKDICLNVVAVGEGQKNKIKWRSTAKAGDLIAVTGFLGDSSAGLKVILGEAPADLGISKTLVERHYLPIPQIKEGLFLGALDSVHAMMDVSDGLASDMTRILESSKCGARIFLDEIPMSGELRELAGKTGLDPLEFALSGGEDYCLLLTFDSRSKVRVCGDFEKAFKRPLFIIGEITSNTGNREYFKNGALIDVRFEGYDHFKKKK